MDVRSLILMAGTVIPLVGVMGCSSPPAARIVYQDQSTVVQLRIDTKAIQAHSHPAVISPDQVKAILGGVRVQKSGYPVLDLIAGQPEGIPAFSLGDVLSLAAPISRAFALASPAEIVTFYRRVSDIQVGLGFTTGGLFMQEGFVYLVLANHRAKPVDAMIRDVPVYLADPVEEPMLSLGRTDYRLSYTREEAEVHPLDWGGGRYDRAKTIIIDPTLAIRQAISPADASRP